MFAYLHISNTNATIGNLRKYAFSIKPLTTSRLFKR